MLLILYKRGVVMSDAVSLTMGNSAVTSRGLNTEDMDQVAEAIALVIKGGEEQVPAARAIIQKLTDKYPLI